jgi:hypothetical protein
MRLGKKQVRAPTVPSDIMGGSIKLEDFRCYNSVTVSFTVQQVVFYATSLSSISIKEEAWTIVHTASTFYKRYCTETVRLFLMM